MATTTSRRSWARLPLAPLGKVTAGALLGDALAFTILMLTILISTGGLVVALLIVALALFIATGLVFTGIRWTPALGVLMGLGTLIGGVSTQQYFVYHLAHPGEVLPFLLSLLICVFAVIAIFAGAGATVQNYRSMERTAPRWLPTSLVGAGGFVAGALLVALVVQATPVSSSASTVNGEAAVHMGVSTFVQSSVTVSKGAKLLLIDDGSFVHILKNGEWKNGTPAPASEAGAPVVRDVQVNSGQLELGPFNTAGTFHIYCTVHPGMTLTVVVQ